MPQNIIDLHQEVLDYLLEKREKYPDLYFTLRTNNPDNRLGKGYWFWGNDESLYFSFWNGIDHSNNTPNISITIKKDGTLFIWLNARDSDIKAKFFEKLAKVLGKFTQTKNFKTGGVENTWRRSYAQDGWRDGLEDFIENDWKKINQFLLFSSDTEDLKSISQEDFEASLRRQNELREFISSIIPTITEPPYFPIKLQEIYLKNIGHFEEVTIPLDKRVTLLIGENGSGKSTILRALALGLVGINQFKEKDKPYLEVSDLKDWLSIKEFYNGRKIYQSSGLIKLNYFLGEENVTNEVSFEYDGKYTSIEDLNDFRSVEENGKNQDWFMGFPQNGSQKSLGLERDMYPESIELLPIIKNELRTKLGKIDEWIKARYTSYLQSKEEASKMHETGQDAEQKNKDADLHVQKIQTVFDIISKITYEDENNENKIIFVKVVQDNFSNERYTLVRTPQNPNLDLPIELLSEGYQNLFYWVGEIVMRLFQVNEYYQKEQPKKAQATIFDMYGVVLIDEIDSYLHPNWQYNILKVLTETFKNLQFLVTSHSPAVLTSLNPTEIEYTVFNTVERNVKSLYEFNPFASKMNQAYRYIGSKESLPSYIKKLNNLRKIADSIKNQTDLDFVEHKITEMKSEIDSYHEDILYAENMVRTKRILLKRHANNS